MRVNIAESGDTLFCDPEQINDYLLPMKTKPGQKPDAGTPVSGSPEIATTAQEYQHED